MINQQEVLNAIEHLLNGSGITLYRIGKDTGINDNTLRRYTTGTAKVENMSLVNGIKLYNYYLKEMEEMENIKSIKRIIEEIENGTIELENLDPNYHEMEYIDGASDHYIIHEVEGQEGLEVFFAEHDHVKEVRDDVYENGKDEVEEFEKLTINEYADQYDYDEVVAYRYDGGEINWI